MSTVISVWWRPVGHILTHAPLFTSSNPLPSSLPGFGAVSQPSPRLDGERELFPFGACVRMHPRLVLNPGSRRSRQLRHPGPVIIESTPLPPYFFRTAFPWQFILSLAHKSSCGNLADISSACKTPPMRRDRFSPEAYPTVPMLTGTAIIKLRKSCWFNDSFFWKQVCKVKKPPDSSSGGFVLNLIQISFSACG